jgi:hypothetical protein
MGGDKACSTHQLHLLLARTRANCPSPGKARLRSDAIEKKVPVVSSRSKYKNVTNWLGSGRVEMGWNQQPSHPALQWR